jgi:hypothetical protein
VRQIIAGSFYTCILTQLRGVRRWGAAKNSGYPYDAENRYWGDDESLTSLPDIELF